MKHLLLGAWLLTTTAAFAQQPEHIGEANAICQANKHVALDTGPIETLADAKAARADPSRVRVTYNKGFENCANLEAALKAQRDAATSQAAMDKVNAIAKELSK